MFPTPTRLRARVRSRVSALACAARLWLGAASDADENEESSPEARAASEAHERQLDVAARANLSQRMLKCVRPAARRAFVRPTMLWLAQVRGEDGGSEDGQGHQAMARPPAYSQHCAGSVAALPRPPRPPQALCAVPCTSETLARPAVAALESELDRFHALASRTKNFAFVLQRVRACARTCSSPPQRRARRCRCTTCTARTRVWHGHPRSAPSTRWATVS